MGETVVAFYRNRVKKSWKTAFFAALVFGLIAHAYKFTNTLPNHDALFHIYSNQNVISSGRWFLTVACGLSGYFDLPWINGLLSLLWIGLTAAVVADLFDIRDPVVLVLEGGLLVTFPCVTNTFFFEFAADGYMLSMLLAALTVRLSRMGDSRKSHMLLASLCICLSCGIYQAYVSFALMLSLCYFVWELLTGDRDNRSCLRWVGKQILVYGVGLLAYWILWKVLARLQHVGASGYQGIDQLGKISGASLLHSVKETGRVLGQFFLGGNVFANGLTGYAAMNLLFLAVLLAALAAAMGKSGLYRRPGRLLLALLCLAASPVAVCLWLYLSPLVGYHMLMLQSLCVLYVFALFLCARYFSQPAKAVLALFFAVLVFRFSLQANASYFKMEQCMEHSRATAIEMLTRIHLLDDGSVKNVAFLGGGDQSLVAAGDPEVEELLVNAHQLRSTLLFDNLYAPLYLSSMLQSPYQPVDEEELARLEASGLAEEMDVWPGQDSLRIVGDTAVIRLPDPVA